MPTINGLKMACEPCIRGHRSTKCTHANERLMVPVRKPGRPLSACPHPKDQPCTCSGGVTAAIPRRQACHCGGEAQAAPTSSIAALTPDPISPSQSSFKVQKLSSRPQASRRQSYDVSNFDRLDLNNFNIIPYEPPKAQIPPNGFPNTQAYHYAPVQYATILPSFGYFPMQNPPQMPSMSGAMVEMKTSGFGPQPFEHVMENSLHNTADCSTGNVPLPQSKSCCAPKTPPTPPSLSESSKGGSCCAPRSDGHSQNSSSASSISEPEKPKVKSCCSSKKQESMPGTPGMTPVMLPHNGMGANSMLYNQYPQTTFAYPPTYGSYQNPLQPSAWAQGARNMMYGIPEEKIALPQPAFGAPVMPEPLDTVHTCGCGDGCQCVGCAAHPYNDATQDYVRSAWASMNEPIKGELFISGHVNGSASGNASGNANGNGNMTLPHDASSPTPPTPSSVTSNAGEEQSLSASDFFFVNYPFSGPEAGCGGEETSCPCGADCACLGCLTHNAPDLKVPCAGDENLCPCGDECECFGCELHGNTTH